MHPKSPVTLEEVRQMTTPAKTFLCQVGANHYAVQFLRHTIADLATQAIYFHFR